MALSVTDVDNRLGAISLGLGKQWNSFEQFRTEGTAGIRQTIREGMIGSIQIGDTEYVLLRRIDFNRLHGLASEMRRLSRGVLLLRQAVEMVLRRPGEELALTHLKDLTMEFSFPTSSSTVTGDLDIEVEMEGSDADWLVHPDTFAPPRAGSPRKKGGAST